MDYPSCMEIFPRPGADMRDETYRAAYEEANAELKQILNQLDQLEQRKTRLERVAEVLKPLASSGGPIQFQEMPAVEAREEVQQMREEAPAPVQEAVEPAAAPVPPFSEPTNDPFQRRINNVLRQGFGSGDGREYSRLFSGLSRGH